MRYTVFDTPIVKQLFTLIAKLGMRLWGWKVIGDKPADKKYVLIAAPHTSNWDFLLVVCAAFCLDLKVYWMGKHTIFPKYFGWAPKWFGGVPVVRSRKNNLVEQMTEHFKASDRMVLVVPAEGTRSNTDYWKTGFYRIAQQAGVPIGMSFVDYKRKQTGIGPLFQPSGDLSQDIEIIRKFYLDKAGRYPELECPPRFKELEDNKD